MKKVFFILAVGLFISVLNPFNMEARMGEDTPCPNGYNTVKTSWWGPSNDHYYTMCSCDTVKGYDAYGHC